MAIRLLLRIFLRLARLQLKDKQIQQQQLLPASACLQVCLLWEAADPVLCCEVAGNLLASLKPTRRQRLLKEMRKVLPDAIETAAKTLKVLTKRLDGPLLPQGATGSDALAGSIWLKDASAALQVLLEALATLRAATCCLPVSFAMQVWERQGTRDLASSSVKAVLCPVSMHEVEIPQSLFEVALKSAYAVLVRAFNLVLRVYSLLLSVLN